MKIILQDQRMHFTVNGSYFPFDPIFRTNQTPTFPENHFWNQFEAKKNEALHLVSSICKNIKIKVGRYIGTSLCKYQNKQDY